MSGAQILTHCLKEMGVKRVYGIIGTSVIAFVDALYELRGEIRYISCRHEQVAASMADTEGRLTGRCGIVLAHSGPGALNTLISLANSYKDSSPLIAIFGGVKRRLKGCDGMLDVDHSKIFSPICKATYRVESADEIPQVLSSAYKSSMSFAKGPVIIEVPEDVWLEQGKVDLSSLKWETEENPKIDEERIAEIIEKIKASERPLILAGGGIAYSGATPQFRELISKMKIPVITTGNGRGTLPETHPLALGRVGFGGGTMVADAALERSDLLLGLGCSISDMTTYEWTLQPGGEIILVNFDADLNKKGIFADIHIYGDVKEFLQMLMKMLDKEKEIDKSGWIIELQGVQNTWKGLIDIGIKSTKSPLSPGRLCNVLSKMLPPDAIITVGAGMHLLYPMAFIPCYEPLTFLSAVNFGAMGFGLAAGMSAKLIYKDRVVLSILGDGEFMMTCQDLETAKREGIGLKIFILNDNSYRVLNYRQKLQFQGRIYGSTHSNPDFLKFAESFGIKGVRIEKPEEIEEKLKEIFKEEGLTLIEVVCDPDDLPPTNMQAVLKMSQ